MSLTFPVATGQRKVVRYIGRTYFAATPEKEWTIRSKHVKGDRTTFGPTGHFLRLYDPDGSQTPYGIHGHASSRVMLGSSDSERYRSMGCIIVSEEVLTLLERTFDENNGELAVTTTNGFEPPATQTVWNMFFGK